MNELAVQTLNAQRSTPILWLAALRGVAAFLVFFSHSSLITLFPASYEIGFITGRIGVTIFFLITGYLTIRSRSGRTKYQYLFSRFIRMYIVYWLFLLIIYLIRDIPFKYILVNMTFFQEFVGCKYSLGSWMIPMQIVFFIIAGFFGLNAFFASKQRPVKIMSALMLLAIITGFVRHKTGRPFPTAFFLLLGVAFLGMYYYDFLHRKNITGKDLAALTTIFEAGLCVAAWFSYPGLLWAYMTAYNLGFLLFWLFRKYSISFSPAVWLGKVSYTFFLGPGAAAAIMSLFMDISNFIRAENFSSQFTYTLSVFIFKLTYNLIFSWVITTFVEKPLLSWSHKLEKKITV